ncbi:ABC transporter permease [Wolinella succinogenes]|uniref:PUTATIVE PERMEASE OF ABC TRANSPORTER n=1 Tax=Wolinella succinogenes (strain ATCC 29543 / DSM 1740 / CCUG 13145 / JCM 31913 / LMG 7466 / NCTC 11488 / FDC 602W) TaxID=273121 RepID=Q7M9Z3_WOLSU|nr:ABC transporter permease [Wolinella succinogenes]NLU34067.1 ABC transporter permease [Wolinella succinogenes]CAE09703.1 PUTATIVE PERMEASE OF ABC TRANSPORTER [Wolinella succinogenes]VEG81918.1 Inner membrane ABC transporter permease protein yejE [Wolinella succinogenes]HCZ19324.1 ABC transporter permease [Helicobacter sp.]
MREMTRRRLEVFKSNRRAYYSAYLLLFLVLLSLLAPLIANDKPLLVRYEGRFYFPILKAYSETTFGGDFETPANYKDPYVEELILAKEGRVVWPLVRYRYDTINYDLKAPAPTPPDDHNWLGTDDQGRDVLARLIYGYSVSLAFGFLLTILSSLVGVAVGAMQGYYGGKVDLLGQRFIEIWSGMPMLFLLIILSSFVEASFFWLLGIMLLFSWMSLVGVVRAEFLRGRNLEYVRSAKALGVSHGVIMRRHILPNAMVATLTFLPFVMSGSIATLTSLDFLGFGLPSGAPSLGELLAQGKQNLHAPHLGLCAFFSIAFLLSILVFVGEGLRDAFDPRLSL